MSDPNRILVATRNRGKLAEFQRLLRSDASKLTLIALDDVDCAYDVDEDGDTFEANACKKACEYARRTELVTLADDSGLEVDALDGAPGVRSARFAGPGASDQMNNKRLLQLLERVPMGQRQARFRCVLALAAPQLVRVEHGVVEGSIALSPLGTRGFGYDPVFQAFGMQQTFGELDPETKDRVSHRGQAAKKIAPFLRLVSRR